MFMTWYCRTIGVNKLNDDGDIIVSTSPYRPTTAIGWFAVGMTFDNVRISNVKRLIPFVSVFLPCDRAREKKNSKRVFNFKRNLYHEFPTEGHSAGRVHRNAPKSDIKLEIIRQCTRTDVNKVCRLPYVKYPQFDWDRGNAIVLSYRSRKACNVWSHRARPRSEIKQWTRALLLADREN